MAVSATNNGAKLEAELAQGADSEDPNDYRAVNCIWVPTEGRWSALMNLTIRGIDANLGKKQPVAVEKPGRSLPNWPVSRAANHNAPHSMPVSLFQESNR